MRSLFPLQALFVSSLFLTACGGSASPAYTPGKYPAAYGTGPRQTLTYRLPFNGTWRVSRTHYGAKNDQAYALDLVLDAPMFFTRGSANADFPSYNQPIVADAPGVVVIAVDGVPDNRPGDLNVYDMHGNFIVIDHQNGEFSLFAHLIPGSLRVRPGMSVVAGTEIGRCGNTGRSSAPHLHWQVMSSANASSATGIAPRYAPYERNGVMTTELPQKGDRLVGR